ncbi:MAG: hypothetical protein KDK99_03810 [Verrucomicrobiales bacterium]|nr:hypothetical protein [Verrucomicrobiales bacterium]
MIEISRKKEFLPVTRALESYLDEFDRRQPLPASYRELLSFNESYPLTDKFDHATHWSSVLYPAEVREELYPRLTSIYALLKTGGLTALPHLSVERVDYCEFGNSRPFRVRVVNRYNDNYDHFYVKRVDASRVYGLELEHLLSPSRISYLYHEGSLVEEHIAGVPGDVFLRDYLGREDINRVRVAKEFVKFSERCFIRLLGDMRSYNYVVDMTPDFEEVQYRVRAIDFDQQSYEGRRNLYLPQFFKENNPVVELCSRVLNYPTMQQYQEEERALIARRFQSEKERVMRLLACMKGSPAEPWEKVVQLREELAAHHHYSGFERCASMGELVEVNLEFLLGRWMD